MPMKIENPTHTENSESMIRVFDFDGLSDGTALRQPFLYSIRCQYIVSCNAGQNRLCSSRTDE
jgi:hypothetical protein